MHDYIKDVKYTFTFFHDLYIPNKFVLNVSSLIMNFWKRRNIYTACNIPNYLPINMDECGKDDG